MKNVINEKFGRLTVLSVAGRTKWGNIAWNCLCDCGAVVVVASSRLISGDTQSCGCLRRERARNANRTHGKSKSATYRAWANMIQRCCNPKCEAYARYGGVGIAVCERWLKFEHFLCDMGERPQGLTLDRIDNAKGYEPDNCRWATRKQQSMNRKHVKLYTSDGKTMTLADWARKTGIAGSTLHHKVVAEGIPFETALATCWARLASSLV